MKYVFLTVMIALSNSLALNTQAQFGKNEDIQKSFLCKKYKCVATGTSREEHGGIIGTYNLILDNTIMRMSIFKMNNKTTWAIISAHHGSAQDGLYITEREAIGDFFKYYTRRLYSIDRFNYLANGNQSYYPKYEYSRILLENKLAIVYQSFYANLEDKEGDGVYYGIVFPSLYNIIGWSNL